MQIFGSIGWLLGFILWGAFYIFKNFGLAIIVFTIIVKAALFPFTLKQQKSMAGSARLAKKQKELREKYGNNRMKLQEELNKLNEKEGVKPMGGCLTTLIPMLILLGIWYAVAYPLTNTLHIDSHQCRPWRHQLSGSIFAQDFPENSGHRIYPEHFLI